MAETKETNEFVTVFNMAIKSAQIVKENWQMFAIVGIFSLLAGFFELFKDKPVANNENDLANLLNQSGAFPGTEIATLFGLAALVGLILIVVNIFLSVMAVALQTKASKGEKPELSEIFNDGKKFVLPMIGLVIIIAPIIIIGFILLIVPGVIALGRLVFAPYVMVDKKLGVIDSIKESNRIGKKHFGKVWVAIAVAILFGLAVSIFGSFPIIGGLLLAIGNIAFSMIIVLQYHRLKKLKA